MSTMETERERLSAEAIVVAAISLADEEGVAGLTMRKLAQRLGYEVMSLYNHIANKTELMEQMVDEVVGGIERPGPDVVPMAAVREMTIAIRQLFLDHQWIAELWLRVMPGPNRFELMEWQLQTLADSGLSPDLAHHGFHAVNNHVIGYTLQQRDMAIGLDDPEATAERIMTELPADRFPHMIGHIKLHLDDEVEPSFELVLDLILDGLQRLDSDRR